MPYRRIHFLLLAAWFCSSAASPAGELLRLPSVVPLEDPFPGRLVSHPGSAANVPLAPGKSGPPKNPDLPPDARPGMFQKLIFSGAYLAGGGVDGLGMSDLELKTILAFPVPSRSYPLIFTPGFAVHYLDGPTSPDVPARLYDAYAQFRWMYRISPKLGIDVGITPGVFSDFQQSSDEAIRIPGHAVAMWTCRPSLKFVLGATYLDREDVAALPVVGLIWTPHDDVEFELIFPRPRIARRIYCFGAYTEELQHWIYLAGELGGGTWAVARTNGENDVLNYRDYRVFLGIQRKAIGRLDWRLEAGYVFGRKIEYLSDTPDFEPTDTVMVRACMVY